MARRTPTQADPFERAEAPLDRARRGADLSIGVIGDDDRTLVQRLRSGSDRLFSAGSIDGAAWNAAARWRSDCEFGLHGATAPDKKATDGDGDYEGARLNALTRYRRACEAVGRQGVVLLTLFEIECLSLRSVAERVRAARRGATVGGEVLEGDAVVLRQRRTPPVAAVAPEEMAALSADRDRLQGDLVRVLEALAGHYEAEGKRRAALRAARDSAAAPAARKAA